MSRLAPPRAAGDRGAPLPGSERSLKRELPGSYLLRFVARGIGLQYAHEVAAGPGNGHSVFQQDGSGGNFAAIDSRAGFIVWAQRRTFEGNAGEKSAGTGVAEDFCFHPEIGVRGSVAALGTRGGGCVSTQLDFAAEDGSGAFLVHDQEDEGGGFAADLHAEAIAFEGI